ncbi:MAG TPA: DNA-binding protein Alba [Candidatus Aenigmarchaeota archaeon]|nr:MAG: DNA-binding protein Alba [Nanoarchaeota archaeon]HDO79932.1 DNA-binding protein Alba [Candidatus Aenigmarchaeota archaeon]HEX32984.1 DNA-binding protein Alba [Candidatus Aenigmarchaeota archaeon]
MAEDNVIFVGNKPTMNYVLAVVTQFHNNANEVEIRARGRAISKAVDVVEIVKNKFLNDVKEKNIEIGTEQVDSDKGKLNVSTITIVLSR